MDTEELRELLDTANKVFYFGGHPGSILAKINGKAREAERDERMRSYWERDECHRPIKESFCILSRRRIQGIVASLDEMLELFRGLLQSSQDIRIGKFVRCKEDIHAILARGVVNQTLRG